MLHEIWGKPTVVRVQRALERGLGGSAQIIVVGIKGKEVASNSSDTVSDPNAFTGGLSRISSAMKELFNSLILLLKCPTPRLLLQEKVIYILF